MTEEYLHLFTALSNAAAELERIRLALLLAQSEAEEIYLSRTD